MMQSDCLQVTLSKIKYALVLSWAMLLITELKAQPIQIKVLIVGGSVSGVSAAISCARLGVPVVLTEETTWLGGMLSAAGVSATDGNDKLYSGLWQQFREELYATYKTRNLATGWVSNTLFEPHVADSIFKKWAARQSSLSVKYQWRFLRALVEKNKIIGAEFSTPENKFIKVLADVVIDATELGDVIASAKIPYDLGLEADSISGESVGVKRSQKIIQDLTYAAILKDYGNDDSHLLSKPLNYTPAEFDGACLDYYKDSSIEKPSVDARKMLAYGKLPNHKFMLNWPKKGNDTYLNIVELTDQQRKSELEKAKATTYRFIYFIQQELGYKNIGIAEDEFPTTDHLPLIAYHREGRRIKGLVRFNSHDIAEPYAQKSFLYRTGIAVGDYPIDHHHAKCDSAIKPLHFPTIPSFSVPEGALLNNHIQNLIAAEKSISVTNVVNGTTRLQPCVLLIGEAAGIMAALSVQQKQSPVALNVRDVQNELIKNKAYIMPYIDVKPDDKGFEAIQKIGATGILKGSGRSIGWANQTWFYPDSICSSADLQAGLQSFFADCNLTIAATTNQYVDKHYLFGIIAQVLKTSLQHIQLKYDALKLENIDSGKQLNRREVAIILNYLLNPFFLRSVDYQGNFINKPNI